MYEAMDPQIDEAFHDTVRAAEEPVNTKEESSVGSRADEKLVGGGSSLRTTSKCATMGDSLLLGQEVAESV